MPARVSSALTGQAREFGKRVIESFQLVGVLCVEMFVTRDGSLLVNELAPRPHNSGHYSLDACSYSQFEALIRTVSGLPIPEPVLLAPCGMVNLLGRHLEMLDVAALSGWGGVKLHLYGKKKPEPNRKMGHVTILGGSVQDVDSKIVMVERMIGEDRK